MGKDTFVAPRAPTAAEKRQVPDILGAVLAKDPDAGETVEIKSTLSWDYGQLGDNAAAAMDHTVAIKKSERRASEAIIQAGEHLIAMKAMLNHGQWENWLKTEFAMSDWTAKKMMRVADQFGSKSEIISDLKPTILYMLVSDNVPEPAREHVIEEARVNGPMPVKRAQEILAQYKPVTPPAAVVINTAPPVVNVPAANGNGHTNGNGHVGYSYNEIVAIATNHVQRGQEAATVEPAKPMAVHFSSETPEHYTPSEIIEAALACMGGIDLDPCSNSKDTPNVPAAMHYTRQDDGLAQVWQGCVYMNPPYGREIDDWVGKLVSEYEAGNVTEAIALVPSRTDTQWWQRLRNYHVCFVTGRLTFIGNDDPAPFPSAVFYLGSSVENFVNAFEDLGDIYHRTRRGFCFGE